MVESSPFSSPWLEYKSPMLSCVYTALSCLSTAATGAGLLYYSSSATQPVLSLVRYSCLGTGVLLLGTVVVAACFIVLALQFAKKTIDTQPSSKSQQAQSLQRSSPVPCCLSLVGMLSLSMLLLSVLLELSLTCLLWWNSHQLGLQYQVRDNCFCTVGEQPSTRVVGILDSECPKLEGLSCTAVYQAVPVQMREGLVMTTQQCQRVDGRGLQSDCLHFLAFWSWFKVWRIVLPLVIVMKLPFLVICCCSWLSAIGRKKVQGQQQQVPSHPGQYNFATSSAALDSQPFSHSPLRVDPVEFYGNMCAAVDAKYVQEKQIVQEHVQVKEMTSLASKPATLRSTAAMARLITNTHAPAPCSPPPLTAVACPVPPVGLTQDDSPPDIQDHIISTPIKSDKSIKTPQFDLSKVIKPLSQGLDSENKSASYDTSQVATLTKLPVTSLMMKQKMGPTHFDFELQNFPQYSNQDQIHSPGLMIPPPPPTCKSSVSGWARSPDPPNLFPPPKPTRTSSISSPTYPFQSCRSSDVKPPPPPIQNMCSPSIAYAPVQVVVDDASDCDYDSSTCGSTHSTAPIVRSSQKKPCTVWPTSPAPPRTQRISTSAPMASPALFCTDIQEISRKARNISQSSNVDWSKLP